MNIEVDKKIRKSGIDIIGDISWGTHLCQFYQTKEDLIDILVPYFKAGLENNEFCMWVTSEFLSDEEAKEALKKAVKNLDDYIAKGQVEIVDHSQWYTKTGKFEADKVLQSWVDKEEQAIKKGFDGLRLTGNTFWLEKRDWRNFTDYEEEVNKAIGKYRMIAICTYSLDKCGPSEIIDVVGNHRFTLIRRQGKWEIIESSERKKAEEEIVSLSKFPAENPNPILRIAEDGTLLYSNKGGLGLLAKWGVEIGEKAPERWCRLIKEKLDSGKIGFEEEEEEEEGKTFSIMIAPVREAGYVNLYASDITERKLVEEQLKESRERLELALSAADMGTWRWNIKTDQDTRDASFNHILGLKAVESTQSVKDFVQHVHPDDRAAVDEEIKHAIREHDVYSIEFRIVRPDGTIRWLSDRGEVYYGQKDEPAYMTGAIFDITERKKTEEEMKKSELSLREQKLALEQKNLALEEMIEHIERAKNKIKDDIANNVGETLMPIVEKLKAKGASPNYIKLLVYHLKQLSSSFGRTITQKSAKLTPREIEICNMIKGGLTSKEISGLLNISYQTIEKHRKSIRKKLGLANKKVNLSSFLQKV